MASFEPSIDYVVTKIPRLTFEKFPGAEDVLSTAMKSVGEAMSIGRTFKESLQKGLRSLEIGMPGLGKDFVSQCRDKDEILAKLRKPNSKRIFYIRYAMLCGLTDQEIFDASFIDPWYLRQIRDIVDAEEELRRFGLRQTMSAESAELRTILRKAKEYGFSDRQLATLWKMEESDVRRLREDAGVKPTFYLVDTCAAEFEAHTPYFYSTYEHGTEVEAEAGKKVMILGGGPNRIGQGIEFDYCCVHAAYALGEENVTSIMVNSNPETVSTDYDTSDKLYFEPLTFEDVMNIVEFEKPEGVIVQFGGQTPLNLATQLLRAGVPILGTHPDSIDRAEDRERFQALLKKLGLRQPDNGTAMSVEQAVEEAKTVGYPVVVRPSYVLGGRAMDIVYDEEGLRTYFREEVHAAPEHPILIDKFLENAVEVDVDALSDGRDVYVAGIMEHIEEAGIHSGDSACVIPPITLGGLIVEEIRRQTIALAKELGVVGLMNIQFAVKDGVIYILEVNPRASRTAPFVSKATGVPLPKLATKVMLGQRLKDIDPWSMRKSGYVAVKESVFPFNRFPNVDILLGPEMRSTGEVMGIDSSFGMAFLKGQLGSGQKLPDSGTVFISVNERDKEGIVDVAATFSQLGFNILATSGTAEFLSRRGVDTQTVYKVYEGRPHVVDRIKNGEVDLVINTASGKKTVGDSSVIRQNTLLYGIPYTTTVAGARAMAHALRELKQREPGVCSLQEYYGL
jgi:carbamoyl-phosphate synthase large subunit